MRLILVRHGETEYNLSRRHMGQLDVPLNERGHQQAQLVGARLAQEQIDVMYTSDLQRASVTAAAIAESHPNTPLHVDPLLRERNVGNLNGQLIQPEDSIRVEGFDRSRRPENGESVHDVKERAQQWLKKVLLAHSTGTVLAASHGLFLFVLLEVAVEAGADVDRADFILDHTSVTVLDVPPAGRASVIHLNDTAHLDHLVGKMSNE